MRREGHIRRGGGKKRGTCRKEPRVGHTKRGAYRERQRGVLKERDIMKGTQRDVQNDGHTKRGHKDKQRWMHKDEERNGETLRWTQKGGHGDIL